MSAEVGGLRKDEIIPDYQSVRVTQTIQVSIVPDNLERTCQCTRCPYTSLEQRAVFSR